MLAETIQTALKSVMTIPHVKGYVTVTRDEQRVSPEANQLPATLIGSVVSVARTMLVHNEDRGLETLIGMRVAMRRIDICMACVIADVEVSDNELQRKLNALAIRTQSQSSNEPPSPVIPILRDLYVGTAGPLSGLVFDRAIEQLKVVRKARSLDALRELMESLAQPITPPWAKTEMLQKVNAALDEEQRRGQFSIPPLRPVTTTTPTTATRSEPPRSQSNRPGKFHSLVVVVQLARDVAGSSSDSAVLSAIDEYERIDPAGSSLDRLIGHVANVLPEASRAKFAGDARARLGVR